MPIFDGKIKDVVKRLDALEEKVKAIIQENTTRDERLKKIEKLLVE